MREAVVARPLAQSRPAQRTRSLWRIGGHLAIVLMVVVIGIPMFWMATASLKTLPEIRTFPPVWLPLSPRWQNYADAWRSAPFDRFFLNSIITTLLASGAKLINAVLCAYALAYLRFP